MVLLILSISIRVHFNRFMGLQTGLAVRLHRFHKITGYVLTDEKLPKHYPTKHGGLLNLREMDEKKITDPYHCSALFGYLDELPGIPYFIKDFKFKLAFTTLRMVKPLCHVGGRV